MPSQGADGTDNPKSPAPDNSTNSNAPDAADQASPAPDQTMTTSSNGDWEPPGPPAMEEPMPTTGEGLPSVEIRGQEDQGSDNSDAAAEAAAAAALAPPLDMGGPGTPKWKIIYYVSQRTTVDDNIFISHTDKKADTYFDIAPGFAAGWGDFRSSLFLNSHRFSNEVGLTRQEIVDPDVQNFVYLNYTLDGEIFVKNSGQDSVDNDIALAGQWDLTRLTVKASAEFQTLSGPDVDAGTRTKRDITTLNLSGQYLVSDKTTFEVDLSGIDRLYQTELNSAEFSDQNWFDYQIAPKTIIGVGAGFGVRHGQDSPDQIYEQAQVRATYNATAQLSLHANGGLEFDEIHSVTKLNPVFGFGATYTIDPDDTLNIDAFRQNSISETVANETDEITGVNIDFKHRIYSSFSLGCSVSYSRTAFEAVAGSPARTDNYIVLRPSITYDFARWSQIELAYEFNEDLSSIDLFSFTENLASLQFNFIF